MIDIEQHDELIDYLVSHNLIESGMRPTCRNLLGGISNKTVLVEVNDSEHWVVKQALEKLRVEADWFSDPQRIHHEADGLRWLASLAGQEAVPGFVFEDHEQHLLIMEAVAEPHFNYKSLLLEQSPDPHHTREFARLLATIQCNSYEHRDQVAEVFADTSFFESLRLEPYYGYSASQLPGTADFLHTLMEQTRTRKLTLVHGDYSPKNVLIHKNRLVLLDHEVIHFGDPAFDIGFSMAHFLSKAHYRSSLRSNFIGAARSYWQTYFRRTADEPWADELELFCARHTLACLLARVAGKSILEYLDSDQKGVQQQVIAQLMREEPETMTSTINQFSELLDYYEQH